MGGCQKMQLTLVRLLRECVDWGRAQASDDLWMASRRRRRRGSLNLGSALGRRRHSTSPKGEGSDDADDRGDYTDEEERREEAGTQWCRGAHPHAATTLPARGAALPTQLVGH